MIANKSRIFAISIIYIYLEKFIIIFLFFTILIEYIVYYHTKHLHNIYKVLQSKVNSRYNTTENKSDIKEEKKKMPKFEDIFKEEKFGSLNEAYKKAKDFLDKCTKGISAHKETFISVEKPKVSAVIPLYNSKNYIMRAIKSFQNQNILELEIVLVNDCSTDDFKRTTQE